MAPFSFHVSRVRKSCVYVKFSNPSGVTTSITVRTSEFNPVSNALVICLMLVARIPLAPYDCASLEKSGLVRSDAMKRPLYASR